MQLREAKAKPKKQDITKRRASLARHVSPTRGKATPRSRRPRRPDRANRDSLRQNHLTNHSSTTHVVDQCSVKPQDD